MRLPPKCSRCEVQLVNEFGRCADFACETKYLDDALERLHHVYRAVNAEIAIKSIRQITLHVRELYPAARFVRIEPSDQEGMDGALTPGDVFDDAFEVLSVPEDIYRVGDYHDRTWHYFSNLTDGNLSTWSPRFESPEHAGLLDLALVDELDKETVRSIIAVSLSQLPVAKDLETEEDAGERVVDALAELQSEMETT